MTVTSQQVEWYIARDGAQHGPISDDEMRTFVELGHLRPDDLVWCQRFTEWLPGKQAFPDRFKPKPAPTAPSSAPTPSPALAAPVHGPAPVQAPAPAPGPAPTSAHPSAYAPVRANTPAPLAQSPIEAPQASHAGAHQLDVVAMQTALERERRQRQAAPTEPTGYPEMGRPGPASQPYASAPAPSPHHDPYALSPAPAPSNDHTHLERTTGAPVDDEDRAPSSRLTRRLATAAAVLLILGGLGWLGWQNRAMLSGATAIGGVIASKISGTTPAEAFTLTPFEAPGETRDLIDVSLQKTAVWRILKRDHPDWYADRLADVERMRAQKDNEKVISKFLADVIVTLRRRNAQTALQSPPEYLRTMASAFVANLKQLSSRDGQTCFGFISFGEAHPFMIELAKTPAFSDALQRQMVAVMDSIGAARTNRVVHANTRRPDYDTLTKELMARGWSQADLATFSDPQKLSASPPDRVCTLVQEWFQAQLALKDADLQARLLAESLKPLVGG